LTGLAWSTPVYPTAAIFAWRGTAPVQEETMSADVADGLVRYHISVWAAPSAEVPAVPGISVNATPPKVTLTLLGMPSKASATTRRRFDPLLGLKLLIRRE